MVSFVGPEGDPKKRVAIYVTASGAGLVGDRPRILDGVVTLYLYEYKTLTREQYEELLRTYQSMRRKKPLPVRNTRPLRVKTKKR